MGRRTPAATRPHNLQVASVWTEVTKRGAKSPLTDHTRLNAEHQSRRDTSTASLRKDLLSGSHNILTKESLTAGMIRTSRSQLATQSAGEAERCAQKSAAIEWSQGLSDALVAPPGMERRKNDYKITTEVRRETEHHVPETSASAGEETKRSSESSAKTVIPRHSSQELLQNENLSVLASDQVTESQKLLRMPGSASLNLFKSTVVSDAIDRMKSELRQGTNKSPAPRLQRPPGPFRCPNMDCLSHHIRAARPGTGEICYVLNSCTFQAREPAFTRLISECGSDIKKGIEILELMQSNALLTANNIHFSALINVCSRSGNWMEAERIFTAMTEEAKCNPECQPNAICYMNLISACLKGDQVERALHWFEIMEKAEMLADSYLYSALLEACIVTEQGLTTLLVILDRLHDSGSPASPTAYSHIFRRLSSQGVKTNWNTGVEVLIYASLVGVQATHEMCDSLLLLLDSGNAISDAEDLLQECIAEGITSSSQPDLAFRMVQMLASRGKTKDAARIWQDILSPAGISPPDLCRQILELIEEDTAQRANDDLQCIVRQLRPFAASSDIE